MVPLQEEKPGSPISDTPSPPPPPPHRSASIMTPTTTKFSPTHSPTPLRRQRALPPTSAAGSGGGRLSPPGVLAVCRGVHNPLATGVLTSLTPSSPPLSEESSSCTVRGDTSDTSTANANTTGTSTGAAVPGLLPHMSRLLTDWDNMSTDSCEEPWDVRHGKVISQLTSE